MFTGYRRTEKKASGVFWETSEAFRSPAVFFASPPGPLSKKRGGGEAPGICGFLR